MLDPAGSQDVATKIYVDNNSISKTVADTYYMSINKRLNEIAIPSDNVFMGDGVTNY